APALNYRRGHYLTLPLTNAGSNAARKVAHATWRYFGSALESSSPPADRARRCTSPAARTQPAASSRFRCSRSGLTVARLSVLPSNDRLVHECPAQKVTPWSD